MTLLRTVIVLIMALKKTFLDYWIGVLSAGADQRLSIKVRWYQPGFLFFRRGDETFSSILQSCHPLTLAKRTYRE